MWAFLPYPVVEPRGDPGVVTGDGGFWCGNGKCSSTFSPVFGFRYLHQAGMGPARFKYRVVDGMQAVPGAPKK